jgi:hypothetical protein
MSRNSKNARLQKLEEALPKNRSAAAKARRAAGKPQGQGRATQASHGKKNAWWQKGTYAEFIKGGGKSRKSRNTTETPETADAAE